MPRFKPHTIFAISRCEATNPFIEDRCCIEYARHTITKRVRQGQPHYIITDLEITKEQAEELIRKHNMRKVISSPLGTIWDTTPSLKDECKRLGITYSMNRGE